MTRRIGMPDVVALVLILGTTACAGPRSVPPPDDRALAVATVPPQRKPVTAKGTADVTGTDTDTAQPARTADVQLGTGEFLLQRPASVASRDQGDDFGQPGEDVTLNFQAADLQEVIKIILRDLLARNFVIDSQVSGSVTIDTSSPLREDQLLPVLNTLLDLNDAAMLDDGDLIRIVPRVGAVRAARPVSSTTGLRQGFGLRVVPLQFVAVAEMLKLIEPIVADKRIVHSDERRNLLILAGNARQLRETVEAIALFDVDWMAGMSAGLYPLDYVAPEELIQELELALQGSSGRLLGGLVQVMAVDRLNALMAVSPQPDALARVQDWIERLDRAETRAGRRLFVYRVRNAKAVDIAAILNQVFSGTSDAGRTPPARLRPGSQPTTLSVDAEQSRIGDPGPPGSAGLELVDGDNIQVIADETNNALVTLATSQEYAIVEAAIEKLDLVPLQVLIEVSIIDVSLNDTLEYGVEWFFKGAHGARSDQGLLDLGLGGLVTQSPAFSYAVIDSAEQVRFVLNALESNSDIDVVSSPSLMVLDNQTASINVGDEIPIPTRQSVSNLDATAPTVNEIEYRRTGVILSVTPRVNTGGLVTLDISQQVSDAVPTTSSDLNAPTIQQREITSVVAVYSGETIILGGLIRDSTTDTGSGVPYLSKVPLVGRLFGQQGTSSRRTELLVLLTPRVIEDRTQARDVTEEFRRKLRTFQPPPSDG